MMKKITPISTIILFILALNSWGELIQITQDSAADFHPAWSPDGTMIAYTHRSQADTPELRVTNSDGNGEEITIETGFDNGDFYVDWSPDGNYLVFDAIHPDENFPSIWKIPANGGEVQRLTPEGYLQAKYSPDGSEIVCTSLPSLNICKLNLETNDITPIVSNSYENLLPCWSPDGTQIAFTSDQSGNYDIWVVPSSGGTPTPVTTHPLNDERACWSPDGTKIAFSSNRIEGGYVWHIWVHNLEDDSEEQMIVQNSSMPDWLADGSKMAFASRESGNFDVWVLDSLSTSIYTGQKIATPDNNVLHQNYPNPFNPITTIQFELLEKTEINLKIYDITGKLIKILINKEKKDVGYHQTIWNGMDKNEKDVPSGLYFYQLEGKNSNQTKPMLLLK